MHRISAKQNYLKEGVDEMIAASKEKTESSSLQAKRTKTH